MKRFTLLATLVLAGALSLAAGCRPSPPAPEPEPAPVVIDGGTAPPAVPFNAAALVADANAVEAQLEGRLLWEVARKCKAREFTSDAQARDWLRERWRKCEREASKGLAAAENDALQWREHMDLEFWLDLAAEVWAAEAKASDPSLEGESL